MNWHCNPYASVPVFPLDTALKAMAIPVIFNLITKGKHPYLAYFSWFLCMSGLVMSAIHLSSLPAIPIIIFYAICSNIIMIDNCRLQELLNDYFVTFTKELEEEQRITEAQKITEMREVIANVAHDLKTPLSSFMTGVELVADKIMEFEESRLITRGIKTSIGASRFSFENSNKEKVKDSGEGIDVSTQRLSFSEEVSSSSSSSSSNRFRKEFSSFTNEVLDLLYNMRNTNSFMLMAINRCIDFSKANSGLKLTPKLESVNLKEAIELPLNCMSNIQNRILIHFKQSSLNTSNICSHIITDKQWLQENVLCLLSNAVKYSTEGTVTVSIDLQSKTIPQPEIEERSSISVTKQAPESTERTKNTTSMSASLSSSSSSSLSVMYRRLSFFPMKKYASILPSSKTSNEGNAANTDFPNQTIFDVESLSTKLRAKEQLKNTDTQQFGPVHSLRVTNQALKDISCLKGKIQCFTVENCDELADIIPLIGTTFVHLNSVTVKDIRPLRHCKIVVLEFLDGVIDVSSLSNLHTLVLVGCTKVTLSIEDCPKITDLSALGGVQVLVLNTEGKFTKFVPLDNQIRHLMCPVDYLPLINQFQNKHKTSLSLIQAPSGFTLFSLKGWKDVSLLASSHVKIDESIKQPTQKSGEKKLIEEEIEEFQPVIRKLELINLPELSLIHSLLHLYYLKIESCHALKEINFQTFLHLKQCWLNFNLNLALIHVKGSIERLTISNSHIGGMEIKLYKRLKQLYIEKCSLGGNIQFYHKNDNVSSSSSDDVNFIQVIKSGCFVIHNNS
eukprot:gene4127-4419_t